MGTWVTCPNCTQDLPHKYKNKKERKAIHAPTCKACQNNSARISFEKGVKRGIWLKRWKKASDFLNKAGTEFGSIGDSDSQLQSELMGLLSELQTVKRSALDAKKSTALKIIQSIISGRYDEYLNKEFEISGFLKFDPLYYEAKGWNEYFKSLSIQNMEPQIKQMKVASHEFFNMGYGPLFFVTYILDRKLTNIELALGIEASSEENLGFYYAKIGDIENASIHLQFAISAYLSLENKAKVRELKMSRQDMRMETACWICGTRNKWHRQTFNFKPTGMAPIQYDMVKKLLKQRQERNPKMYVDTIYSTADPKDIIQYQDVKDKEKTISKLSKAMRREIKVNTAGIYLATCTTCQGLIDELAEDVVNNSLIPVWQDINSIKDDVQKVFSLIKQLEARMAAMQGEISSLISAFNRATSG